MDMMYKMIAKAIQKKGPQEARVTDYLNFYTLGSRRPIFTEINETVGSDNLLFTRLTKISRNILTVVFFQSYV